jgi:hypothetical protein
MMLSRIIAVVAVVAVMPFAPAVAQFGGIPGMPGGPSAPGFGAPSAPPPECQKLLELRAAVEKHGNALQAANKRKVEPTVACRLFKNYLAADLNFIKGIQKSGATCGVPPDVPAKLKAGHAKAAEVGKQVCEVAELGPRPVGPSLSDALGTPLVPDETTTTRTGPGTFDTLTGNPLTR